MAGSVYSDESNLNLDADRLIELTDNAEAQGVANQAVLDDTSLDAQSTIDGKLSGVYVVPFQDGFVPAAIQRLHSKLWRFNIYMHRDAMAVPPAVLAEMQQAMSDLEDYATPGDGGMFLPGATRVSAATGQSAYGGSFSSDPCDNGPARRVFGRFRDRLG